MEVLVLLIPVCVLVFFGCIFASMIIARMAGPRFKSLEMRGAIRKPVPDLTHGRVNNLGGFDLLWRTPIPEDRPQLKRLVSAFRACQIAALASLLVMVAIVFGVGFASTLAHGAPPTANPQVQDH